MKRYFYSLFLAIVCCALTCVSAWAQSQRLHTVMPGETFYSLSKKYEVTIDAIKSANPQLGKSLPCGMQIVIPQPGQTAAQDAKPAVSKEYVVKDHAIKTVEAQTSEPTRPVKTVENYDFRRYYGTRMRVALVLPFCLKPDNAKETQNQMRYVEFYEGFLIAVDELQKKGLNLQLKVIDLDAEPVEKILSMGSLMGMDLIIGPIEAKDVAPIADFATQHNIPMVNPFVFDAGFAANYANLYQLNTPKTMLYEPLTHDLLKRFDQYTYVFMNDSLTQGRTDSFVPYLQAALDKQDIDYYEYDYSDPSGLQSIDSLLDITGNILFVPNASDKNIIKRAFPYLRYLKGHKTDSLGIAVLGYPEWQVSSHEFMDAFYDLNVHIFTKIYVNPFDASVKNFYQNFKYWYHKEPMAYYPQYALLGYDMASFFLGCYGRYGGSFAQYLDQYESFTLQNAIHFERVEQGGYINKAIYLVQFNNDATIVKNVIE